MMRYHPDQRIQKENVGRHKQSVTEISYLNIFKIAILKVSKIKDILEQGFME